jgi:hypothetical protein
MFIEFNDVIINLEHVKHIIWDQCADYGPKVYIYYKSEESGFSIKCSLEDYNKLKAKLTS